MRADLICEKCRQPLRHVRAGVQLTNIKARLFDLLREAGDIGLDLDEMRGAIIAAGSPHCTGHSVKSHISQMRDQLEGVGWAITCKRRKPARWFLVRRKNRRRKAA